MYLNPPSLPPSLIFGSFGSHFGNISWHSFPCFSKGLRFKKKMKPKFLGFRQFLTFLPSLSPPSLRFSAVLVPILEIFRNIFYPIFLWFKIPKQLKQMGMDFRQCFISFWYISRRFLCNFWIFFGIL